MSSRFAEMLATCVDDAGVVDRAKLLGALLIAPEDPATLLVDACLFLEEIPDAVQRAAEQGAGLMRNAIVDASEKAIASIDRFDVVSTSVSKLPEIIREVPPLFEKKIVELISAIDTEAISDRLSAQLQSSALVPLREIEKTVKDNIAALQVAAASATQATEEAKSSLRIWSRHRIYLLLSLALGLLLVTFGGAFYICRERLIKSYERRLAARVSQEIEDLKISEKTVRELGFLGVAVDLRRATNETGDPLPGIYALVVNHVENAAIRNIDGKRRGLIFFRSPRRPEEIDAIRKKRQIGEPPNEDNDRATSPAEAPVTKGAEQ